MSTTPKGALVKPGTRMNACRSLAPDRASLPRTSLRCGSSKKSRTQPGTALPVLSTAPPARSHGCSMVK